MIQLWIARVMIGGVVALILYVIAVVGHGIIHEHQIGGKEE